MSKPLEVAFADIDGAVCSTFFGSVDLSEKLWESVERLAEADDGTFWTVAAHHERLSVALINAITAVDHAHSSHSTAQRRAVTPDDEQHLVRILIRLATSTEQCSRRQVDSASLAARLSVLLPWKVLFPASLMLLRHSGAAASVTLTSLILLNPGYLCTLNVYMPTWWDNVNRLAVRCARELQRGRYQRLPGDILSSFEQVYRLTKQLWAVIQCAPFLADYLSLPRTLRCLRVLVDVVSPILQHFAIVCDDLAPRRAILSRANSVIINSAVNASSVLLLFHTYAVQDPRRRQEQAYGVPSIIQRTYSHLREYLHQYARGFVEEMLQAYGKGSLQGLISFLYPPVRFADDAGDRALGQALLTLTGEIADSNDFADAARSTRQRYFELLLLELVRQGLHINDLLSRHLVTPEEASKLGASAEAINCALAGLHTGGASTQAASAKSSPSPTTLSPLPAKAAPDAVITDPLVAIVMEVFPQYNPAGVRVALNFYSNDVEQLIMDASMENLPPHLVGPLNSGGPSDAELAAALVAEDTLTGAATATAMDATGAEAATGKSAGTEASKHLVLNDFDETFLPETLYRLLGSDLYEFSNEAENIEAAAEIGGDDEMEDAINYKITMNDPQAYMSDAFDVDEEMKAKIRMLNEIMYEDELDDGQQDGPVVGADFADNDSDSDVGNAVQGKRGRGARTGNRGNAGSSPEPPAAAGPTEGNAQAPPQRAPRDAYHDKRYHEKRSKDRQVWTEEIQAVREAQVRPAYANKKKTSKANAGGQKSAMQRAMMRGKFTSDF